MSSQSDFDLKLGSDRSYVHNVRLALLCLVLGGAVLATARLVLWQGVPEARFPARIGEILGWMSLAASAVLLFAEWRHSELQMNWMAGRSHSTRGAIAGGNPARAEAIDKLYAELRPLMSQAATDPGLQKEIQKKLSHLRQLQNEEAEEMERRFEGGLLLKPGEGLRALERAKELLAQYENPSVPDGSSERKD